MEVLPKRLCHIVHAKAHEYPHWAAGKVPPKVLPEKWKTRKNGGKLGEMGENGSYGEDTGGNGGTWGNNGGPLEDRLLLHREAANGPVQPHVVIPGQP